MYITSTKRHNRKYLQLAQSTKEGIKIIKNIGYLDLFDDGNPNYLKELRESLKKKEPLIEDLRPYLANENRSITVTFSSDDDNLSFSDPKNIGYFFLDPFFDTLGIADVLYKHKSKSKINYDLTGITKLLTYGRILNPASKLSTLSQNENYYSPVAKDLKLNDIYKTLDVLDLVSKQIQTRMNYKISNSKIGRDTELVYYDVTNYYYEIENNDEDDIDPLTGEIIHEGPRKRGVSKEHRPQPLTQMGLFIDDLGIPISYKIFPGNHIDQTTFRPAIKETIDTFDYKRVIVVADRGLNSDKNIAHLIAHDNGYVMSKSIKKNKPAIRKWILEQDGYKDTKGEFVSANDEDIHFKSKSQIIERIIIDENGEPRTIKEKLVSFWSKNHYLREVKQNKKFMDYLDKVIEFPGKLKDRQSKVNYFLNLKFADNKTGEILKPKKIWEVNDKKIQEFIDLMGFYLIATSEIDKSDSEIIDTYHGLSRIEDSFRITKSDLQGRPVFVRDEAHINAHFLICFISLTIIRLLQLKVLENQNISTKTSKNGWQQGITAKTLKQALNSFTVDELPNGFFRSSRPTIELEKGFDLTKNDIELRLPNRKEISQAKQNLSNLLRL
jgi:transposase